MTSDRFWDFLPFWITVVGLELIVLGSILVGMFISRLRRRRADADDDTYTGTVVGAILGLLAFILAFTFGMTASRFDARKEALLDEVNAIETTFLRAGLIPEPHRSEVRALLKRYVDIRADLVRNPANIRQVIQESEAIQGRLWPHAVALADADLKNAAIASLFIDSLNEMFDLQTKRITVAVYNRVPIPIWMMLMGITVLAMVQVRYLSGRSKSTSWFAIVTLSFAFSMVVVLIADLDRVGAGAHGAITVNQQPVVDLQKRLSGE